MTSMHILPELHAEELEGNLHPPIASEDACQVVSPQGDGLVLQIQVVAEGIIGWRAINDLDREVRQGELFGLGVAEGVVNEVVQPGDEMVVRFVQGEKDLLRAEVDLRDDVKLGDPISIPGVAVLGFAVPDPATNYPLSGFRVVEPVPVASRGKSTVYYVV